MESPHFVFSVDPITAKQPLLPKEDTLGGDTEEDDLRRAMLEDAHAIKRRAQDTYYINKIDDAVYGGVAFAGWKTFYHGPVELADDVRFWLDGMIEERFILGMKIKDGTIIIKGYDVKESDVWGGKVALYQGPKNIPQYAFDWLSKIQQWGYDLLFYEAEHGVTIRAKPQA